MFLLPEINISPLSPSYFTLPFNLHPFSACSALLGALDTEPMGCSPSSLASWLFIRFSQWEAPMGRERVHRISSQLPHSLGTVPLEVARCLHDYSVNQAVPLLQFQLSLGSKNSTSFLSLWPYGEIMVSHFSYRFICSLSSASLLYVVSPFEVSRLNLSFADPLIDKSA